MTNKPKHNDLTKEQILARFIYEPETGLFRYREDGNRKKSGDIAGVKTSYGYITIAFGRKRYFAHRLAWVCVYGVWPGELDHINRVRDDNRIENLRQVPHSTNIFNQKIRADNTSGYRRVSIHPISKRWVAHITVHGKSKYLGSFDDPEEAHQAYLKARRELLGKHDTPSTHTGV